VGAGASALGGAGSTQSVEDAASAGSLAPGAVAASEPNRIGAVTHYYEHAGACVVALEAPLRVGDTIHVRGHTTDFYQRVERLERDHATIEVASAGDEVGVQVSQRVRPHDAVYRLTD
jgi:putative protease